MAFVDVKTEGKIEAVKTMLGEGFESSVIAKIIELTLEEIENLPACRGG